MSTPTKCACLGAKPGHRLCPCRERMEEERRAARVQPLTRELERERGYFKRTVGIGRTIRQPFSS